MESEDLIKLPASSISEHISEDDGMCESGCEAIEAESLPTNSELKDEKNAKHRSSGDTDTGSLSGVKRPRTTVDVQQPSVHVFYKSLTRESKNQLEELLQQWSRWHAQNCSSSNDSNAGLESGEETYFPALHIGSDKPTAVTFWVDNQKSSKEFIPLDATSVPLYDRGYSLALAWGDSSSLDVEEKLDASRCFNCGSYVHQLKDCPKPFDNVAVNNARKQHKSRRNQHANSHNSTRYYQNSRGGKYDGLMPGVLDSETRQLLGLGELDPPPWLRRMREIGYPLGYLDSDEEDQPSGITIFGDELDKEEIKAKKILDASYSESCKKKSVEFPGINAPIPKNADEILWAPGSSSLNLSKDPSHRKYNHSSVNISEGHLNEPGSFMEFARINAPIQENADKFPWASRSSGLDPSTDRPHHRYNYSSENISRGHLNEPRSSMEFPRINTPIQENADEFLWSSRSSSFHPSIDRPHHKYNYSSEKFSRGNLNEPGWFREFQEINAPIEEFADERAAGSSSFNLSRDYSHGIFNHAPKNISRVHLNESRWPRNFEYDWPPVCDSRTSPSLSNHYNRYGDYSSSYTSILSPRATSSRPWSPNFGKSWLDRDRRSSFL
ncbi:hypothetical protein ACJIZ3_008169 [Penstemon smallii]|uniref:CCHC-type domain-containing protein n=1 Tax=Penstemon smallii TaxID=265156 RepID=A0ABD3TB00_9LAMI